MAGQWFADLLANRGIPQPHRAGLVASSQHRPPLNQTPPTPIDREATADNGQRGSNAMHRSGRCADVVVGSSAKPTDRLPSP